MLKFNIDNASPVAVYQQVRQTILLEIMSQRLQEGDKLPSIRSLAKILKLNPNTIAKVYYSLEEEGFLLARRGSGYLVKAHKAKLDNLKKGIIEEELKGFLEKAFSMGFSKEDITQLLAGLLAKS